MKKYLKLIFITSFLFILSINSFAEDNIPVEVQLNQNKIDFPDAQPVLIKSEGRTIVPVRFIAQQLGAVIHWDKKKQEVYITLNDKVIVLGINNNYAMINQNKVTFDSSARLMNGRTYVPLRFVSEALECSVDWDKYRNIAHITSKGNERPIILPNKATGNKELDAKAIASLDSNFKIEEEKAVGGDYNSVIYSASDGSNGRFVVDLTTRGPIAVLFFDKSILESSEIENAYKKVLKFYFGDDSDEVLDFIIKMDNNKEPFDESKNFNDRGVVLLRAYKGNDLMIFIS
ncbi:copper amine oxidase N-terminal domain-containing protein [Dethiothermospora halolimnae]|uniref:copper amine oxidase N-terminal domain-containing protein n=1 Tax=Dethiothermospora halolimnae TaxID=3114390 RepID=UPI003CCBAA3C